MNGNVLELPGGRLVGKQDVQLAKGKATGLRETKESPKNAQSVGT